MNPDKLLEQLDISDLQDALTEEEKDTIRAILSEISDQGSSATLENLWYADYEEIPVDIYTFITDRRYLGESFLDSDGNLLIYSFWVEVLKQIFSPTSQIFEVGLSGAIGLGKSTIATIGMAYVLYKLLCLKDPAAYYRLTKGSKVAIAIFNISLD